MRGARAFLEAELIGRQPARSRRSPVLADTTTVMSLGLVLGALLGAGLAGTFGTVRPVSTSRLAAAAVGGLLLGYGARMAFGRDVGALFSGIASTGLHGWLWGPRLCPARRSASSCEAPSAWTAEAESTGRRTAGTADRAGGPATPRESREYPALDRG